MTAIAAAVENPADSKLTEILALGGSVVNALSAIAYSVALQVSAGAFTDIGYYYDLVNPTKAMQDASSIVNDQMLLLWGGGVIVGAILPLLCAFLGKKNANWKLYSIIATACVLVGAICVRMAFYGAGMSLFMFY